MSSTIAFELGPGQLLYQVLRTAGVGRDERQIDFGLHRGGEFDLRPLGCVAQTLQGHFIAFAAEVEAFILLKFVDEPVHDALIQIVAAQVRVAVGGFNFDHAFADFQNRNIEGSAAEVVDGDRLVFGFVEAVGQRRCRGLIDDALYVESGNLPGIFRSLALRVVKIRGNGDDRFGHFLAEIVFRSLLQLLQNQRGNLRGRVLLALRQNGDVVALTAQPYMGPS